MLFDLINYGDFKIALIVFLLTIPSMLIALTFHEVAHGFVAYKCGDPTAKYMGRLTLNPIKHLDPIGTLLMLVVGYGWARPVPVNSRYFKKPRRDMALTALAGPVTNLLLGFVGVVAYCLVVYYNSAELLLGTATPLVQACYLFTYYFAMLNLVFAVFNMIPLPPFDGSRIFLVFLPPRYYFGIMKYERYILLGMLVLMYVLPWSPINLIADFIFDQMANLVGLILF